jgi:hypothetical protein
MIITKLMANWKSFLKKDIINWLLEKENPSVRYYTLTELLKKKLQDSEVKEAKEQIMKTGVIPKILSKQNPKGYWGVPEDFYIRSKYKGTVWSLILLAELGADGSDKRIKNACEFILNNSQNPKSGGFSYERSSSGGGIASKIIPCLTGNMVWSLIRFGYIDDLRIQKGIKWILNYQRIDDGKQNLPKNWPYYSHKSCFGKHSCHMGVVKSLKALSEIPENKRTKEINNKIDQAVEYILIHHIYKRSHNLSKISKPSWLKLGFPHMYQCDILEILDILTNLGYNDKRMQDAIDIVISKQNKDGPWILESTYNGRFQVDIERKNKPSKWITLNALRVLKKCYM